MELTGSELLCYGGAALAVAAVVGGLISAVVLRVTGRRLRSRLREEYGEKQR